MTHAASPPEDLVGSADAVGHRFATAFAALVVVLVVLAAFLLDGAGRAARWDPPALGNPVIVDDSRALLAAWEAAGVRNAVLVQASHQLGFQGVLLEKDITVVSRYPVEMFDFPVGIGQFARRENRVWVASQRGMFRTIHYVFEESELVSRVEEGLARGYQGIASDGRSITPNTNGYLRHIAAEVPRLSEPAVLDVDASYFESGSPSALLEQLMRSGLDYRLVTLNRAEDDTSTTDAARARLERFGELLKDAR